MVWLFDILKYYLLFDFEWMILSLIPGIIMLQYLKGKVSNTSRIISAFLHSYVFLVLFLTIFARSNQGSYRYQFELFASYRQAILNPSKYLADVLVNFFMLMPIGIFMPRISTFKNTMFFGFSLTLLIEVLQLVTMRGYFQMDDIFGNTVGLFIGCVIYQLYRLVIHHVRAWKRGEAPGKYHKHRGVKGVCPHGEFFRKLFGRRKHSHRRHGYHITHITSIHDENNYRHVSSHHRHHRHHHRHHHHHRRFA